MSQFIVSVFLNAWLVVAVALFVAIVWQVFRPSAQLSMQRHALIPFKDEGGER